MERGNTVLAGCFPTGEITLTLRGGALEALSLNPAQNAQSSLTAPERLPADDLSTYRQTLNWLSAYFGGTPLPVDGLPLRLNGSPFQLAVWEQLRRIPFGSVTTYGQIAKELERIGAKRVSARAVGGAVGKNPLPLLLPCHRVIGADGRLTGFSAGLDKKICLLTHEGHVIKNGRLV